MLERRRSLGAERVHTLPRPAFAGEDFGHIPARVPGALLQLGTRVPDLPTPVPNHSPLMRIHEDAPATGVALPATLALS
ncbi:hypothetical protein [Embleya sp. AB8]|uniref:hypothetical protein n=1 Tax=Embleya sp. AB8 TaxID=3156304 RepID=UPI003C75F16F